MTSTHYRREEMLRALELRRDGATFKAIAMELGCTSEMARNLIAKGERLLRNGMLGRCPMCGHDPDNC